MYGHLYMQLGPPQIVNQAHVLSSLILWLHRYKIPAHESLIFMIYTVREFLACY